MKGASQRIEQQLQMVRMLQGSGLSTYCREVTSGCGPTMIVEGREVINCISNSYMGFSVHPRVIEAARAALLEYGMGIGGSPLACGTTRLHNRLSEVLAAHYGKEDALVFASGYKALAGTIQGLLSGKGDMALIDSLAHRSIIDGCVLARCKMRSFKHNDAGDLAVLVESTKGCEGHRMVIVDSVYSMDGDVAPLPRMVEICRPAGVTIMIDEAHAMGILGKTGRGLMEHFNIPGGADVVAGTFSKFAGAVGGYCAADRDVIEYLRYYSSPYVFSAALPPATTAAVLAAFELLESEPQWLERLWENVRYMLAEVKKLGFDTGTSCTPCIPIFVRDTEKVLRLCRALLDRGLYASPVIHPGVPLKQERIRMGLMASHTREHLDRALEILRTTGREFELIP